MSLLSRLVERRDFSGPWADPNRIPRNSEQGGTTSGLYVNEQTALTHSALWACVSLLTETIAAMPVDGFRKVDGSPTELDPRPLLLRQPHPDLDMQDWQVQVVMSLLLRGNAYAYVAATDQHGYPTALLPLDSDKVQTRRNRQTRRVEHTVNGETFGSYPHGEILHIKGLTLPGGIVGLSPIDYARQALGLGLAAEDFGGRYFGEGTTPSGVLEVDGDLTPTNALAIQATWQDRHTLSRRPAVLAGGAKWKQISVSPEESQFIETRRYQTAEIARFYRVPPHMIGDVERSTSWGTGIEEQGLMFITYTLQPWLVRIENALTSCLPSATYCKFNVEGLLRGRTIDRYKTYLVGRQGGWLNVDEIRDLEDLPPLPDGIGESYIQPLNFGPLGEDPVKDQGEPDKQPTPPPVDESKAADEIEREARIAMLEENVERLRGGRRLSIVRDDLGIAQGIEESYGAE